MAVTRVPSRGVGVHSGTYSGSEPGQFCAVTLRIASKSHSVLVFQGEHRFSELLFYLNVSASELLHVPCHPQLSGVKQ